MAKKKAKAPAKKKARKRTRAKNTEVKVTEVKTTEVKAPEIEDKKSPGILEDVKSDEKKVSSNFSHKNYSSYEDAFNDFEKMLADGKKENLFLIEHLNKKSSYEVATKFNAADKNRQFHRCLHSFVNGERVGYNNARESWR